MYIISKNKDYYDGVVGTMGVDKTLVYERITKEITEDKEMLKEFQRSRSVGWITNRYGNHFLNMRHVNTKSKNRKNYEKNSFFIVGFCGKLYLGWKFHYIVKERDERGIIDDVWKTDIIYGYENAKEFLKEDYWDNRIDEDVQYIMNYDPINMFREALSPIFIYDGDNGKPRMKNRFIINPILKEWEFYKVVDAFTAFQEISMFIGGVLGIGEKEMIEIEDKYKIPQHGFDKWSFRKKSSKVNGKKNKRD